MRTLNSFTLISLLVILQHVPASADWVQTNGPYGGYVVSFVVSGTNLFAGTSDSGVFLSTNNGISWTSVNTGLPTNTYVTSFAVSGTNLFAGTSDSGVFLSTNNGISWTAAGLANSSVNALAVSGTYLFAGISGGVFLSTNNGTNWTSVNTGLTSFIVSALAFSDTNLFAGTTFDVYLSTNHGTSWIELPLTHTTVNALAIFPTPGGAGATNLFAGSAGGGVFLSTNNGTSWITVNTGLTSTGVSALAIAPASGGTGSTNLFAAIPYNGGVFLSTNNGTSWTAVNSGLTTTHVSALAVSGTNLFAGTWGGGVWRRPLSEMTAVHHTLATEMPNEFFLSQNYPNPFNPSTKIAFDLPTSGFVSLKVYDELGREVATLVNEILKSGSYEKTFDASDLVSGVYFYRLQAGEFMQTKKLTILR